MDLRARKKRLEEFLGCPLVPVPWLSDLSPGARVHSEVLKLFHDIGADGQGLAENIQLATGMQLTVHLSVQCITHPRASRTLDKILLRNLQARPFFLP